MYRRQALVESGGFDEGLKSSEDWELYLRLIKQTPLYCHHQIIGEYRVTAEQMSRRWHIMLQSGVHVMRLKWRFVQGNPLYEDSYYEGLARLRARYGEMALWQMVADARSKQWAKVLKTLWVLLKCYPQGVLTLLKDKGRSLFLLRK